MVEQDRARQAEQEGDAERSRAEGFSALLEATRLQLAEQRALMTDQALARALKVAQEANALRQTEKPCEGRPGGRGQGPSLP